MPVIADLYSSKHLKCADLGGRPVTATIKDVSVELFQNDGDNVRKAVVHFHGNVIKPLVVNKTNYVILNHAFGPNTDMWVGKQIIVSPSMTPFKGKMVETIRVEPLLAPAAPAVNGSGELRKEAAVTSAPLNDEIPKSW
jgi:hypothetical protein